MMPRLLTALSQNGAAIPMAAVIAPPNAGPTARLTFMPALLAAIADGRSVRGTSCATIACQTGAVSAPTTPRRNVNASSTVGVTIFSHTSAATAVDSTVVAISTAINMRRRSTMSPSAPAGSAKRNIGKLVATWTSDTVSGSGSRPVMSQPAPALYIQVPILATTVAPHSTANAG